MILKKTWLNVSDNSNVNWCQTFHLYGGFFRKKTKLGFFAKTSARIVEPPRIEYKGFKFKYNKKGDICRGLIIRNKFFLKKKDGFLIFFKSNNLILLKKKQELKSKFVYGPVSNLLKRKKFLNFFKFII